VRTMRNGLAGRMRQMADGCITCMSTCAGMVCRCCACRLACRAVGDWQADGRSLYSRQLCHVCSHHSNG
jgi:hypothetical protein